VKVLTPTPLLAEAAEVLANVRDAVVVVGATALEAALADAAFATVTPTRDVDVVVPVESVPAVVAELEGAGLRRSDLPNERAFTWVRGDLKVQLVRSFHPFPGALAKQLPQNTAFGMAARAEHQTSIAFLDDPGVRRLVCANGVCLLALKQAAFGRTRASDGRPVERDYHDAYLVISQIPDAVLSEWSRAAYEVRQRATDAIRRLAAGGDETAAAARQIVRLGAAASQRAAEADVRRAAARIARRIDVGAPKTVEAETDD